MSRRMASLKRCGHWKVTRTPIGESGYRDNCAECGEALWLGYSDEHSSEAVEIEIRAAELADNDGPIRTCDNAMPADCEQCGWDCWPWPNAMHEATPAQWAGYLGHQIARHDEEARAIATHGKESE